MQDTHQVLIERTLDEVERRKLKAIGSTNVRPENTLSKGYFQPPVAQKIKKLQN